jgi:hypothetical protein
MFWSTLQFKKLSILKEENENLKEIQKNILLLLGSNQRPVG